MLFLLTLGVCDTKEFSTAYFHGATESSYVEDVPWRDCTRTRNTLALGAKTKLALLLFGLMLTGRELRRPVFNIDRLLDKLLSISSAYF